MIVLFKHLNNQLKIVNVINKIIDIILKQIMNHYYNYLQILYNMIYLVINNLV